MKALRVYMGTVVLGGCFDPELAERPNSLIEDFRLGRFLPALSADIAAEVAPAPEEVRALPGELVGLGAEEISVASEALALLGRYRSRAILGPRLQEMSAIVHDL